MATVTETPVFLLERIKKKMLDTEEMSSEGEGDEEAEVASLEEMLCKAMPGPFRCRHCKAAFLRGPNSRFCIACGALREGDASAFHMSFGSTMAYALLMSSFDDPAPTPMKLEQTEQMYSRGEITEPQDELTCSKIANLELRWSHDDLRASSMGKSKIATGNQHSVLPMAVDLEAFFDKSKDLEFPSSDSKKLILKHDFMQHVSSDNSATVVKNEDNLDLFSRDANIESPEINNVYNQSVNWKADFGAVEAGSSVDDVQKMNVSDGHDKPSHTSHLENDPFGNLEGSLPAFSTDHLLRPLKENQEPVKNESNLTTTDLEEFFEHRSASTMARPVTDVLNQGDSSSGMKESDDAFQSEWPDGFQWTNDHDPFSVSAWQNEGVSYQGPSDSASAIQNGSGDFVDLIQTSNSLQTSTGIQDSSSKNDVTIETDWFNRIEAVNFNSEEIATASQDSEKTNFDTTQGSKTDASEMVDSLLSKVHDLSFMLSDHLVLPDPNTTQ